MNELYATCGHIISTHSLGPAGPEVEEKTTQRGIKVSLKQSDPQTDLGCVSPAETRRTTQLSPDQSSKSQTRELSKRLSFEATAF